MYWCKLILTYHIDEQIDNSFKVLVCSEENVDNQGSDTVEHGQHTPCHKELARDDMLVETYASCGISNFTV